VIITNTNIDINCMKNYHIKLIILFLLGLGSLKPLTASPNKNNIDTLLLYEKLSGVGITAYFNHWFWKEGTTSYRLDKTTPQDTVVLNYFNTAKYIKLYNLKNQLIIEGLVNNISTVFGLMTGDIKLYKKGQLVRIEHWDTGTIQDSCGHYLGTELPFPLGMWSYFKKGRLFKTKNIEIRLIPNTNCVYEEIITTTKYSKKGKILWVKERHKKLPAN
jgi:hypothetical protein